MGLFRYDNLNSGDNYNNYVQPRLSRQKQNVMVGGRIRSPQDRAQNQGGAIRQIGGQTRALQGRSSHNYFMNRGGYFPGSRR